jgi:thioredoxin-like negative regulator of GroEL
LPDKYPKITFATFNVDDNVETPASYNVRGVPMFVTYGKDGVPAGMKQGNIPIESLEEMLDDL